MQTHFTSEGVNLLREVYGIVFFPDPIMLQLRAGEGVTVLEVFERDKPMPQVPLDRIQL